MSKTQYVYVVTGSNNGVCIVTDTLTQAYNYGLLYLSHADKTQEDVMGEIENSQRSIIRNGHGYTVTIDKQKIRKTITTWRIKIHRDSGLNEYQVRVSVDGKSNKAFLYFTDDREDAERTINAIIHRARARGINVLSD